MNRKMARDWEPHRPGPARHDLHRAVPKQGHNARGRCSVRVACALARACAVGGCTFLASASAAHAQSIEPRAYSNAPVGVNFLIAGYAYTRGGLAFDTSVPVTNPHLSTSSAVLAYARVLDLWGNSGKFDAIVPLSGTADSRANRSSASSMASPIPRSDCRSTSTGRLRLRWGPLQSHRVGHPSESHRLQSL